MELDDHFIDVSEHQGSIDFQRCASQGVRNAIPRAGINGRYDLKYERNVEGFRSVGIGVPATYWFLNPKSSVPPEQQGALARRANDAYGIDTCMLDAEWYSGEGGPNPVIKGQPYVDWCRRFIAGLGHITPIIYTSGSFWNDYAAGAEFADIAVLDTVIASYKWQQGSTGNDPIAQGVPPDQWPEVVKAKPQPLLPRGWDGTLEAWQFSAGGNKQGPVYGTQSGDLDLNVVNSAALKRWYGGSLDPQEDEVGARLSIVTVFDGAQELDAKFVTWSEDGWFTNVSWCDGWRVGAYRSKTPNPPLELTKTLGELRGAVLDGQMPTGDRFHDWVPADFFSAGIPGPQGVPGPVPSGTFPATVTIG